MPQTRLYVEFELHLEDVGEVLKEGTFESEADFWLKVEKWKKEQPHLMFVTIKSSKETVCVSGEK